MYKEVLNRNQITEYATAILPEELWLFGEFRYAVSFLLPLPRAIVRSIEDGPTALYFHHYRTMNAYLDRVALEVSLAIRAKGYDAVYIPASQSLPEDGLRGQISHKAVAAAAGLGSIGMNALFISRNYGPAVRLSTVVTDMPLPQGSASDSLCTNCGRCVKRCPAGALYGVAYQPGMAREEMMDAKKCSIYMKKDSKNIGRGAVCGRCIAVCPLCFT